MKLKKFLSLYGHKITVTLCEGFYPYVKLFNFDLDFGAFNNYEKVEPYLTWDVIDFYFIDEEVTPGRAEPRLYIFIK